MASTYPQNAPSTTTAAWVPPSQPAAYIPATFNQAASRPSSGQYYPQKWITVPILQLIFAVISAGFAAYCLSEMGATGPILVICAVSYKIYANNLHSRHIAIVSRSNNVPQLLISLHRLVRLLHRRLHLAHMCSLLRAAILEGHGSPPFRYSAIHILDGDSWSHGKRGGYIEPC
jgi:hypothetical protein